MGLAPCMGYHPIYTLHSYLHSSTIESSLTNWQTPTLIAIVAYYGIATVTDLFFTSSKIFGLNPIVEAQIQQFFKGSESCSSTPVSRAFNLECLLPDLNQNLGYEKLSEDEGKTILARLALVRWFLREILFLGLIGGGGFGVEGVSRDRVGAWR